MNNKKYELVVCGGGLAGVCAAVSSARYGVKTAIIQDRPVFGGNASSEIRVNIGGAASFNPWARETGIMSEICLKERRINFDYHISSKINSNLDLVLYDLLKKENVDMYLNASVRKAIMKRSDLIEGVLCIELGSERDFVVYGDYFIDATGDGVVAFSSGAEYRIGREGRDEFGESLAPEKSDMGIMGSSLMFLVRDVGKKVKFDPPSWIVKYKKDDIALKTREHSYMPGYWWIEIGEPFDIIHDNEEIKHQLLAHLLGIWDHLKNEGEHGFDNFVLEWVGMVPGKRESRRIIGDYILTENDLKERKKFPDAIAYGGWGIDLHIPGGILAKEEPPEATHTEDPEEYWKQVDKTHVYIYQIPYRCLYSKNIKNLLMAGRNISVSHVALGSTRLMETNALLGQATGIAVYLCKKYNCFPRDITKNYIKQLQQFLLRDGVFIPDVQNEDKNDVFLSSKVKGSSEIPLKIPDENLQLIKLEFPIGQKFPLSGKVEKIIFKIKVLKDTTLNFHLFSSFDLWDFEKGKEIKKVKINVKKNQEIIEIPINKELEKGIYWFYFEKNENIYLNEVEDGIPGCCKIIKPGQKWVSTPGIYSKNIYFKTIPEIYCFSPENVISGVSRPEKWTNVWISENKYPQFIEFEFKNEERLNYIQFIFDAVIEKEYHQIPPFYIPESIPAQYKIYYFKNSKWNLLLEEKNNTCYFKRHFFKEIKTKKIKVEFLKTYNKNLKLWEVRGGMWET